MGFKKLRGVALPEEQQGLVRYTCLNSDSQPKRTQEKIQRLCDDVGGAYSAALRQVMCSRKSITAMSARGHFTGCEKNFTKNGSSETGIKALGAKGFRCFPFS